MGSGYPATLNTLPDDVHPSILELRERHQLELQNLTLTTQPFRTLQLFIFSTLIHLKRSFLYVLMKGSRFMLLSMLIVGFIVLFMTTNGSREKHSQEFLNYFRFVLWWVALGVASSIGLGSGLHTFVLYLGPHIAFFTIKAMKCGRVDLKFAPYDTIQLKRGPSWLEKDCAQFGPPLYLPSAGSLVKIPVSIILPHVQLEAVLWGIGTALGELPPYFISSAARLSGNKLDAMEELDTSSKDDGFVSAFLKRLKRWFLNHSQHLNFFTILVLASVPNPLFDLAGIMCGQFGIPFWKFFLATLIGKAVIKTHIQTVFIICVCNNQLLEWVENELFWVLGLFPGFSYMLPNIITKLHLAKERYLSAPAPVTAAVSDIQGEKQWNMSFSLIWNSVVWLMLVNFFIKIVTATAQSYLKKQQDMELKKLLELKQSNED
ncbi:vacuole membrane protein KMS1-like [Dioscorea cayenensis subsp. rotundata]|uniref:Vacuole membrane protein KMS1-like n=1 Tax=Dioscorea cayennensis subsp. rotundata TaxID=55577 RepID=A0AB40CUT6_DIOCR|nr:vacuole membrane protein KMS1-like [Dioscorea cayenensis subsp. rotundata]